MNDNVIEIADLVKAFNGKAAVNRLTLNVPRGSVFGFLGANGAGKTTTIRAIVGHLHPTAGTVRTLGADPYMMNEAQRRGLAYVSENMALPGWMSPRQAVRFCAAQTPHWDDRLAKSLLSEFQLETDKPYRALSKGQRRRVCLLTALAQGAELLVLDEPASGLDVEARRQLLDQILNIACDGGRTVFFSSHLLTDLERVVDRVAVLDAGQLALEGELDELKARVRKLAWPGSIARDVIESHFDVLQYEAGEDRTQAVVRDFSSDKLNLLCAERGFGSDVANTGLSLEDMFLAIRRSASASPTSETTCLNGGR